ncbi:hypothetical protein SDC9_167073 [bioreactor metagenome]|uniref:Uncharacterized protein n=1 Tax=bioreactor metagenome TaxID=1076179 RepID=A0A645FYS9_9ZZZZ
MLTQKMMDYYQISDMLEIIDVFYDPPMERHKIAKFVSVLFDCAARDDAVSIQIIKNQAKKLADTTIALLQKLPQNIKIGIWGGVFVYHEDYFNAFKKHIYTYDSGYQIEVLKYPPEIGAVLCAMKAAGLKVNDEILLNMEKTLIVEVTDEKIG